MRNAKKRAKLAPMPPSDPRQIAARVRARLKEMGTSESDLAVGLGRHRSVFSTILRRLEKGGNVRSDTLRTLEGAIGKSQQWILTGEEAEGVRLADIPGWAAISAEAGARYKLAPEALEEVGRMRLPSVPTHFDAAFVGALAHAWAAAK